MAGKPAPRAEQHAVVTLGWPVSLTHGSVSDYEERRRCRIIGVNLRPSLRLRWLNQDLHSRSVNPLDRQAPRGPRCPRGGAGKAALR
jgi:hypothetical protein